MITFIKDTDGELHPVIQINPIYHIYPDLGGMETRKDRALKYWTQIVIEATPDAVDQIINDLRILEEDKTNGL